jgi:hypothetical protein
MPNCVTIIGAPPSAKNNTFFHPERRNFSNSRMKKTNARQRVGQLGRLINIQSSMINFFRASSDLKIKRPTKY